MRKNNSTTFLALLIFVTFTPFAFAHQPRIVESNFTNVIDPEISKAYYGNLTGIPDVYVIHQDKPFNLYVNVLVPDIANQKKDLSVKITKNTTSNVVTNVANLDGINFEWKKFFEPFGHDSYWMGPEYKSAVEAGDYKIEVSSLDNKTRYSLAIGEMENFDLKETLNAVQVIPELKKNFFNESPVSFLLSPIGLVFIFVLYLFAFIFGLTFRYVFSYLFNRNNGQKKFSFFKGIKNLNLKERMVRLAICVVLLLLAISTSWNPVLIFLSGLFLFQAIFCWCGFYSLKGRNI